MNEPTQNDGGQIQHRFIEAVELRDYFAAQALAGDLSSQERGAPLYEQSPENSALVARRAYKFADAMLKARAAK